MRVPMTPLLSGIINLLDHLTELRKTIYLLDYWAITKDIKEYNEQRDEET